MLRPWIREPGLEDAPHHGAIAHQAQAVRLQGRDDIGFHIQDGPPLARGEGEGLRLCSEKPGRNVRGRRGLDRRLGRRPGRARRQDGADQQ